MLPVGNPYLDAFTAAQSNLQRLSRSFRFGPGGTNAEAPDFMARRELCAKYAWAIPNEDALQCLADLAPIVEIGAGTGYWAAMLRARGVHIEAIDCAVVENDYHPGLDHWTQVAYGTPNALKWTPAVTLFLCWPAVGLTAECLSLFRGTRVALVADPVVVGADAFRALESGGWSPVHVVAIPTWPGFHDALRVFDRR